MKKDLLATPVLLLIFNRPDLTKEVFETVRKVRPLELYVAADGARDDHPDDAEKCLRARDIVNQVDWNCRVETLFREENLGCRVAIGSAIDWFFGRVEEGIILEDDCIPSESFFWFCEELLEKYRYDQRIMQISGNNYLFGKKQFKESYYFSKLNGCWGWATWKRAWRYYQEGLNTFEKFEEEKQIYNYFENKKVAEWMMSYLEDAAKPGCSIWSAQWSYALIVNNGLCISPAINLVQNVGFGESATHGKNKSFNFYSGFKHQEMGEIVHPPFVLPDREADDLYFEIIKKTDPRLFCENKLKQIIKKKIISGKMKDRIKSILKK
ncbi:MAG: hypothetical protein ABSG75_14750 [Syntrophales bacterium]